MNDDNGSPHDGDDLLDEYDLDKLLKDARVGVYAERYADGTNVVLLDPDVASAFKDSQAVNAALRLLMEASRSATAG